jgi:hypothetical protein
MSLASRTPTRLLAGGVATVALVGLVVPPALASQGGGGGDDVVRRGSCARTTDWKVKVGPEDGRLEVEGEIDSNRAGQTWRWVLFHDGSTSAAGTRQTAGRSGSFEVRRVVVDRRGTDTLTFRARNTRSGELCVGTVHF